MEIDIDNLMKQVSDQTPMQSSELILKDEIMSQKKIYTLILLLGVIMLTVSILI